MIQRKLLHQLRALTSKSSFLSPQSASRTHFPPIRISLLQSKIPAPRAYSTATDTSSTSQHSEPPPSGTSSEGAVRPEDPVQKELEAKNREIIDLKDKYLRSVADFRNLQDRTKRDIDTARTFAISRFAADLIDSIDNLDRALSTVDPSALPSSSTSASSSASESSASASKALNDLYQGLKMTESILMQTLKKHGLERFDPSVEGEKFDPNLHDAAFQTRIEGKEDGTCFDTIQKGFLLNGRVVRAAKVGVVKNS